MTTAIKLYNTLSRKKEVFRPLKKGVVRLYTCGPTVYHYAHIGNLRTYIFEDILERMLRWNGYRVKRVMNITDVGHLTSDADTGKDKVEEVARAERKSVADIARFYTKAFLRDLKKLNIRIPTILAPATRFVLQQIAIIERLIKNGFAYETGKAVYFDVAKFPRYGALARQALGEKKTGAREEVTVDPEKRNAADFVLWFKRTGKFKYHLLHWPSPWGEGFPGWHIECSAISSYFLGQPFDIHTGGVDLIGTHHTNEIAQSEGAFGKPLARFWLHGEHLLVADEKMAKSKGNVFTLAHIEKHRLDPLAFRYLVLNTHYRTRINFTWKSIEAAKRTLRNLSAALQRIAWEATIRDSAQKGNKAARFAREARRARFGRQFTNALNDDLNTPRALATLQDLLGAQKLDPREKLDAVRWFDTVLGLSLEKAMCLPPIPAKITRIVRQREQCRRRQQFVQADRLRKELHRLGYEVEDTPRGPFVWPRDQKN